MSAPLSAANPTKIDIRLRDILEYHRSVLERIVRSFIARLSLGCLVFCSCLSFAGDSQWVEVRSPNFSVITDAGEKRGRDVALHFEQMRSVFGSLLTKANVNLSVSDVRVAHRKSGRSERSAAAGFDRSGSVESQGGGAHPGASALPEGQAGER